MKINAINIKFDLEQKKKKKRKPNYLKPMNFY